MRLVFLGPPGAGKGTIAERIHAVLSIPHISTGDLFRKAIHDETSLGKQVKEILDSGHLVPDELTTEMVKERLVEKDAEKGFILDGYPRTLPQADALKKFGHPERVVNFMIPEEIIITRLSGRRVCRKCHATYNIKTAPPGADGICDVCGGELYMREDDAPEKITKRLHVYADLTQPLIEYYRKSGLLMDFDTNRPVDILVPELATILKNDLG
jgi:adenylate kinase